MAGTKRPYWSGQVTFKDKRTNDRLLTITQDIYARPQANIPQACGMPAKIKAAYRFFKHKETSMEKILSERNFSTQAVIPGTF